MARPEIELTEYQKEVISMSCINKTYQYISEETGLSKYLIRKYLKQKWEQQCKYMDEQFG